MSFLKSFVVHASSEDEQHPLDHLCDNIEIGKTQGWQSQRFCDYPQEIIFQMEGECRINQIKIVSHEFKICSKVEIYIGQVGPRQSITFNECKFRRIGYISFNSNEQSDFKARELKSVKIDVECSFVKFTLLNFHPNQLNIYNQVGIAGIQFVGQLLQPFPPKILSSLRPKQVKEIILEDLKPNPKTTEKNMEFVTNIEMDPYSAQKVQELTVLKVKAVQTENYLDAHKYKLMIDHILRVSSQLLELEKQKEIAAKREDYARCVKLKAEIDRIRNEIEQGQMDPPTDDQENETNQEEEEQQQQADEQNQEEQQYPPQRETQYDEAPPRMESPKMKKRQVKNVEPEVVVAAPVHKEVSRAAKPKPKRSTMNHDDIPVKGGEGAYNLNHIEETEAVVAKRFNNNSGASNIISPEDLSAMSQWERLIADDILQQTEGVGPAGKLLINDETSTQTSVFGSFITKCLNDGNRVVREAAVNSLRKHLQEIPLDKGLICNAVLIYATRGCEDKIPQIAMAVMELVQEACILCENIKKPSLLSHLEFLIDALIKRSADNNSRVKTVANQLLMYLSEHKIFGYSPFLHVACSIPKLNIHWQITLVKLRLAEELVNRNGIEKKHYSELFEFTVHCLAHSNATIRNEAIKVFIELCKFNPKIELESLKKLFNDVLYSELLEVCRPYLDTDIIIGPPPSKPAAQQKAPAHTNKKAKEKVEQQAPSQPVIHKEEAPVRASKDKGVKTNKKLKQESPQVASSQADDDAPDRCDYCYRRGINPEEMDNHLLFECPCLTVCDRCNFVVEVVVLNDHKRNECLHKDDAITCNTCLQVVAKGALDEHMKSPHCRPLDPKKNNRCPLCFKDIPSGNKGWIAHLIQQGCPVRIQQQKQLIQMHQHPQLQPQGAASNELI